MNRTQQEWLDYDIVTCPHCFNSGPEDSMMIGSGDKGCSYCGASICKRCVSDPFHIKKHPASKHWTLTTSGHGEWMQDGKPIE